MPFSLTDPQVMRALHARVVDSTADSASMQSENGRISIVSDDFEWLELQVPNLEAALEAWDPVLTGLGFVGRLAWDKGRSYALGRLRVLFVEANEDSTVALRPHALSAPNRHVARGRLRGLSNQLLEHGILKRKSVNDPAAEGDLLSICWDGKDRVRVDVVRCT